MKKAKSLKRITNLMAAILILLGVIPFTAAANITTVYADDEGTTEPAASAAEETYVEEVSTAPEVEEAAPAEDAEAEGNEAGAPEEAEDVLEDPVAAEIIEAEEETLPEVSEAAEEEIVETEAAVDVSEIVEMLSEAEVQIVDENGEAIPLASKEASEVLVNSDPFFWSVAEGKWVGYTESGSGCPVNVDCRKSTDVLFNGLPTTPFQAAVIKAGTDGAPGSIIYVANGEYHENVVVDYAGLSFTAFHSIEVTSVANAPVVTMYTSGYALVDKITLNVDFGTTEGVYAKEVIVNEPGKTGGWLDDAMALVNDGGTIEADMVLFGADGHYRVRDANVPYHPITSPGFEWECGEPDESIWLGRTYRMVLKDPSHEDILGYYETRGDERSDNPPHLIDTPLSPEDRLEDLVIAVNVSEQDAWTHRDEERIHWYLLGDIGRSRTGSQQDMANEITRGVHDDIAKTHSIWFLWPIKENGTRVVSPENRQLTFFGYESRIVYGCTDPESENYDPNATIDNGLCVYPVPVPEIVKTAALGFVPGAGRYPLITAGIGHTCALTAKEGLECWGLNESGQVGDSSFVDKLEPVDVVDIDPDAVIALVSGIHHTCVLTSEDEVFCWGLNSSGQLGDGTTENRNEPVLVDGLEGTIISISAGAEFTCALNSADEVFCWGNNSSGQLNNGLKENNSIPVKSTTVSDAVLISGGSLELQGITSDGAVQLWNSQPIIPVTGLPDEDNTFVSADRFTEGGCSMTDVGDVNCWGGIIDAEVIGAVVSDMLASGEGHACTMKAEGLVCWGSNSNGQLGDDSLKDSTEEVLVTELEKSVIVLAAGMKHTCIIYEDETIACWGLNEYGQLGNSTTDDSMVPVETK